MQLAVYELPNLLAGHGRTVINSTISLKKKRSVKKKEKKVWCTFGLGGKLVSEL